MAKVSKSMFLMNLDWKCCLNAMAACAKTTVKPSVLNGFTNFTYSVFLSPGGRFGGTFLCPLVT